jgi:hopanoid biosynthesis associated protein HpnK
MVGAPAAADAIERARRLPRLRVGLHLVLVEGRPVLPPERLPDLVDPTGHFRTDVVRLGLDIAMRPSVRHQIESEIQAQFERFHASGLILDHVNAHRHYHLHPMVARAVVRIGTRFGARGLRVPLEPASVLASVDPKRKRALSAVVGPWTRLLARRARRAAWRSPDAVFGLAWSGAMTAPRLAGLIRNLPAGTSEIYLHPAVSSGFPLHAPGYRYAEELAALIDPRVAAAARAPDIRLGGYSDMPAAHERA